MTVTWEPSAARTIILPIGRNPRGFVPGAPCTQFAWPTMNPGDALDFSLDFAQLMADVDDTIEALSAALPDQNTASGLSIKWAFFSGTLVTLWIYGGVPMTSQPVTVTVRTAFGRIITASALINLGCAQAVIGSTGPDVPPLNRQLPGGAVLTGNGTTAILPGVPINGDIDASDPSLSMDTLSPSDLMVLMRPDGSRFDIHNISASDFLGTLFLDLPSEDPQVSGYPWINGGAIIVSQGKVT